MGLLELGKYRKRQKSFDFKKLIESNLYVFKENLKLMLGSVVDQICLAETTSGKIENALIKEFNRGKFEEIAEEDESGSDTNSHHSSIKVF